MIVQSEAKLSCWVVGERVMRRNQQGSVCVWGVVLTKGKSTEAWKSSVHPSICEVAGRDRAVCAYWWGVDGLWRVGKACSKGSGVQFWTFWILIWVEMCHIIWLMKLSFLTKRKGIYPSSFLTRRKKKTFNKTSIHNMRITKIWHLSRLIFSFSLNSFFILK